MIYVQDTLMGFKYQANVFAAVPKTQGLGVFLELDIGQGYSFADEAGKREYRLFRGHGVWKDRHDFKTSDIKLAQQRAANFDKIARKYPHTDWYYSFWCEHKSSAQLAQKAYDAAKEAAPHCTIVNCPLPDGAILPSHVNEVHSYHPRSILNAFSYDGRTPANRSAVQTVEKAFPTAKYFATWRSQYNGKKSDTDSTPRPQRKDWATIDQIKQLVSWV